MNKTYPNTLRQYRLKAGLRQMDVAKMLEADCMDRISRWENGLSVPSIVKLFSLAVIYKVSPQELFPELWQQIAKRLEQHPNALQTDSVATASADSCGLLPADIPSARMPQMKTPTQS